MSYSPDSNVRISSSSIDFRSATISVPTSASEHAGVVQPTAELLDPVDLGAGVRQLRRDLLSPRRIVPQARLGRGRLQLSPFLAHARQIEHDLDIAKDGIEALELFGVIDFSHSNQQY